MSMSTRGMDENFQCVYIAELIASVESIPKIWAAQMIHFSRMNDGVNPRLSLLL
jgi:hypothetical protein